MDWLTGMSVYILFRGVNKRRGHCIDNVLQSDKSGFTALQLYSFTAQTVTVGAVDLQMAFVSELSGIPGEMCL